MNVSKLLASGEPLKMVGWAIYRVNEEGGRRLEEVTTPYPSGYTMLSLLSFLVTMLWPSSYRSYGTTYDPATALLPNIHVHS